VTYCLGHLGYASRELFAQFLHRISVELPAAKVAVFSTLKYINAPNFDEFRAKLDGKVCRNGFIVHSKAPSMD
ncbi:MAG: hypothetical protein U5N55_00190, partial [Cypionkella sp.]|nr:hypothetical protein [Cypionkella sp.]